MAVLSGSGDFEPSTRNCLAHATLYKLILTLSRLDS